MSVVMMGKQLITAAGRRQWKHTLWKLQQIFNHHTLTLFLSPSLLSLIFQLHPALRLVGLAWRAVVRWTAPLTSGVKRKGPVSSSAAWWKLRASTGSFCVWWASTLCVWPSSTTINLSGSQQPSVSHTQVHYHTSMQLLVLTAVKNVFYSPFWKQTQQSLSSSVCFSLRWLWRCTASE